MAKFANQTLPDYSYELQQGVELLNEAMEQLFKDLLSLDDSSFTLNLKSAILNGANATSFAIGISYGCAGSNVNLDEGTLNARWSKLVSEFVSNPVVRIYFTFPPNTAPEVINPTPLTPTPPSLPPQEKNPHNNSAFPLLSYPLFFLFLQTLFMFVFLI